MSYTLTILGCGYIGSALAQSALQKGWKVTALTRNRETAENLEDMGIQKVVAAYLNTDEWHSHLDAHQDSVVN